MENEQHYAVLNDDQINKLKYIPPRKTKVSNQFEVEEFKSSKSGGNLILIFKLDKDGNSIKPSPKSKHEKIIKEKWLGYSKNVNKVEILSPKFVKANFTQGYQAI